MTENKKGSCEHAKKKKREEKAGQLELDFSV